MDKSALQYFKTIGKITSAIQKESTVDGALKAGIKIILDDIDVDYAIIWYVDEKDNRLHPYYWICPEDLTSKSFALGEGIVGKTFESGLAVVEKDKVCTPFSIGNLNLGCVELIKKSGDLTDDEGEICQLLTLLMATQITENIPMEDWQDRPVIMSVRNVKKEFVNGDIITKVLKGINFDVFEGEFLCFLGESGCGKSTILNIIGGMDKATEGTFSFMGDDFSNATEDELTKYRRDNIGFIFQSYNLMPNLTAKQNLELIGELVEDPMDSMEALKLVGLEDRANNYPSQLSGGQQQRISIARALIKKPKVIMADEPTAALDYATSIEVLETLEDVIASGTTLIMVTHNEEITRMANRVIRFRNGQVYEVTINNNPAKAKDLVW